METRREGALKLYHEGLNSRAGLAGSHRKNVDLLLPSCAPNGKFPSTPTCQA